MDGIPVMPEDETLSISLCEARVFLERIAKDPVTDEACQQAVAAYATGGWQRVFEELFGQSLLSWCAEMCIEATNSNLARARELFSAGRTSDEVLAEFQARSVSGRPASCTPPRVGGSCTSATKW